jgi:biotin-[acetyl-CoA-carboxylase] ligase BirA-like protein
MTGMLSKTGGAAITIVDSATSSSDLVWAAAAQDAPSGTAFLVREQTAGRGRRGAGWSSARGGMYFSILLRPAISQRLWFGLSFVAALAIRQELARCLADVPVMLKWPNDVLAGGGKLCGILLEGRGEAVVIGTGVNIAPVDGVPWCKTAGHVAGAAWRQRNRIRKRLPDLMLMPLCHVWLPMRRTGLIRSGRNGCRIVRISKA